MKKKILILFLFGFLLLFSFVFAVKAETSLNLGIDQNNLPAPVQKFLEIFQRIKVNINFSNFSPTNLLNSVKGLWEELNQWFESQIGISFKEIFLAFANLIIWMLELFIKLTRWATSFL